MSMTTQEIIEQLARMECVNYNHYSAPRLCTKAARDRLEELKKDNEVLALAVCSGNSYQAEKLVQQRDECCDEVERLVKERNQAQAEIIRLQAGFEVHSKFAKERDEARVEAERLQGVVEAGLEKQKMLRAEVERLKVIENGRAEIGQYKSSQQTATRPEPSRLEIAAMIMANAIRSQMTFQGALDIADGLIAAAREGK